MGEWAVSWDQVRAEGKILAFDEITEAGSFPGLYAWYSSLGLGAVDLEKEEQTRSALRRQTAKYRPTPLLSEIKGNLGTRWVGELSDTSMNDLVATLSQINLNQIDNSSQSSLQKQGQRINRALSNLKCRKALVKTLEECIPIFLPPLYVGISNNLQRRLQEHISKFRTFSRNRQQDSEYFIDELNEDDNDEISGTIFAARAIKAGFKEDDLRVYVLPFQNLDNLSPTQVRDVIGGVEFLLNRWAKPSLGVR